MPQYHLMQHTCILTQVFIEIELKLVQLCDKVCALLKNSE